MTKKDFWSGGTKIGSTKAGTIVAIEGWYQKIQCDDGLELFLRPNHEGVKDGKVGDRVLVTYKSTPTLGLWYAEATKMGKVTA